MVEGHANNFVARAFLSVPRTVERGENVAFIFGWKLIAGVKTQIERGRVSLHKHIGDDDFVSELRMFPFVARIDMVANVKPGPAIKTTGPHAADVIRRQILTDFVTLVRAHPEFIAAGPQRHGDGVPNSPRVNFSPAAIGIELENTSTIRFGGVVGDIGARADGNIHFLAIGGKDDVARPVSAAAQVSRTAGKMRTQLFGRSAGFEVAVAVRKSNYTIRIGDV